MEPKHIPYCSNDRLEWNKSISSARDT